MTQLSMGKKVESEHKGTVKFIKSYQQEHGRLPPAEKIYEKIALDHLHESRTYYSKLKKAKL